MTRTQYATATSFDGFIADPDHSLSWLFEVPRAADQPDAFAPFFAEVGAVAMGSTTFEWVVAEEGMRDDPSTWHDAFGDRPTWVFSSRDLEPVPGVDVRFVTGDVTRVHADMVAAAGGGNVWLVGGGDLVGQFADAGLLDEVHLAIQPVFLGAGAPLLPRRITSERLHLRSIERVGQEVQAIYDVVDPDAAGTDHERGQDDAAGGAPGSAPESAPGTSDAADDRVADDDGTGAARAAGDGPGGPSGS